MENMNVFAMKEQLASQEVILKQVRTAEQEVYDKQRLVEQQKKVMDKEFLDLEKMEKLTLTSFLGYLSGRFEEKMEKERTEALQSKLAYDHALAQRAEAQDRLQTLRGKLGDVEALRREYEKCLADAEEKWKDEDLMLQEILEGIGREHRQRRELDEAVSAGENLRESLEQIGKTLQSARNWGIFDMLGGRIVADVGKHMKINQAQMEMDATKIACERFTRELSDVEMSIDWKVDISDSLKMFDIFLDNIFLDIMVQGKIRDAQKEIQDALEQVGRTLADLKTRRQTAEENLEKLNGRKEQFLLGKFRQST